jgi:hypothetical protein
MIPPLEEAVAERIMRAVYPAQSQGTVLRLSFRIHRR